MERPDWSQLGLHVISKPTGPVCNMRCKYCFYLEKEQIYPKGTQWKMSDETLEAYIRQYIEAQPAHVDEIDFAFQGGEPTLMGIEFFRRAVEFQRRYTPAGKRIHNSLQTNGIRIDHHWCEFLKANDFLVGLSIDGPAELHNRYRVDRKGEGTHAQVMRALELLKRHQVDFNALACVGRHTGDHPARVYQFLRDQGVEFIQFIPIVEPLPGVRFGGPPPENSKAESLVTDRTVRPGQFGRFLIGVFEEWVRRDVGKVFVRDFDEALACWIGAGANLCVYSKECGRALAIEHNGDLYSCDHYVFPEYKLGNIHQTSIRELANSALQEEFGRRKWDALPEYCLNCEFLFACNGACPKDRSTYSPDGEFGLNYLCQGFKMFFGRVAPYLEFMAGELRAGRAASGIMRRLRAEESRVLAANVHEFF